jgi:EAL domain-containing protein (putative c-di-GMP-specific phosphodiesterase class I)
MRGREFGDQVLREIGRGVQALLDETGGIASRFESDRFDIYCPQRQDWQASLARLQARLDDTFRNAGIHLRMGVDPWQRELEPVLQFDRARAACNSIRSNYTTQVAIYDSNMEQREERNHLLLNDFSRALKEREFEVFYQPKYYIQAEKPRLSSVEALVRWRHPRLGLIPPDEFIPLFEGSGQIVSLDNYVWAEAARQTAVWRDQYGVALPVSVNLSRVDVFDPNLFSTLDRLVSQHRLSCRDLKLEVTESAYTADAEQLVKVIKQLRSRGYEIEMDDFGSGYSSLNMLSTLPVDILKMDIEFIRNIEHDEKDLRLV